MAASFVAACRLGLSSSSFLNRRVFQGGWLESEKKSTRRASRRRSPLEKALAAEAFCLFCMCVLSFFSLRFFSSCSIVFFFVFSRNRKFFSLFEQSSNTRARALRGTGRERERPSRRCLTSPDNHGSAPRRRRRHAGLRQLDGRRGSGPRPAPRKAGGRRCPHRGPFFEPRQPRGGAPAARGVVERISPEAVHHARGDEGASRAAGRGAFCMRN